MKCCTGKCRPLTLCSFEVQKSYKGETSFMGDAERGRLLAMRRTLLTTLISCSILLFAVCSSVAAQSGRRPPPPKAPSRPAQSSEDDSARPGQQPGETARTNPAESEQSAARIKLLVGCKIPDKDAAEVVRAYFLRRLNESSETVATFIGQMTRDEALKRAQSETEAYVVWLQIEVDSVQNGDLVFRSPDLVVKYSLLSPKTAQVKYKGKVYYQAANGSRKRSGDWPSGTPIRITPEATGIEAAEGVLAGIKLADRLK